MKHIISTPGKFMQGHLDDDEFEEYIVSMVQKWIKAKLHYGRDFETKKHVKEFEPITGSN